MTALRKPSYEDLEAENAWLRDQLGVETGAEKIARLRSTYGLRQQSARVVILLFNRRGRIVSRDFIIQWLPEAAERRDGDPLKLVDAHIFHARAGLPKGWIENVWGVGYRLAPTAADELNRLFEDLS